MRDRTGEDIRLHTCLNRVQRILSKALVKTLWVYLRLKVQRTAKAVDATLLILADISVRYCLAQCFACLLLGAIGEIVDISGVFTPTFCDPSESSSAPRDSDILTLGVDRCRNCPKKAGPLADEKEVDDPVHEDYRMA